MYHYYVFLPYIINYMALLLNYSQKKEQTKTLLKPYLLIICMLLYLYMIECKKGGIITMSEKKHKCFISFKSDDIYYKEYIQDNLDIDMIDKSLNDPIDSEDEDYIMRKIREDYLSDSTVTIFLIGTKSAENSSDTNQAYIKRELQASLYNGSGNSRNGILGVVLPDMIDTIYKGKYTCSKCGKQHNHVSINNNTTIREFNYNYYLPKSDDKCAWNEDDRYCVLAKWEDFCSKPEEYIEQAFKKRSHDISRKVKVYPK